MDSNDEKTLVNLLKKLSPGFLPYDVFLEVCRLVTVPIVEFVPLRMNDDDAEVLLLKRDDQDMIWPGAVHTPGTVIRSTDIDSSEHLAFKRITQDELKGTKISEPFYVGSNLHKSKRGAEQAQIFWVEVFEEPKVGEFYPIADLPDNIIDSQRGFIKLAVDSFIKSKN